MVREEARRLKALLNAEEDARFGESLRGDELPEELRRREDRLAAAAKERAAQREARAARSGSVKAGGHRGEPEDKAQSNFTDSAKTGGFQHNAQVAGERQLIVATDEQCKRPRAGLRGQGDLRRAARDGAWPATAMNGTCRHLKRAASTWRRGARARGR